MEKKINKIILAIIVILIGGSLIFSLNKHNNIKGIYVNLNNREAVLTEKADIREFMNIINSADLQKEPLSIITVNNEVELTNNVILTLKDGSESSFFLTPNDSDWKELLLLYGPYELTNFKINEKETNKILDILDMNNVIN